MSQFWKTPDPPAEVPINTTLLKTFCLLDKHSKVFNFLRLLNPVVSYEVVNDGLHDVLAIEHSPVGLGTGVSCASVEIRTAVGDIHWTGRSVSKEIEIKTYHLL